MDRIAARELKQHTGEIISRLQRGERLLLTHRGSPIAIISPLDQQAVERAVDAEAEQVQSQGWLALSESAFRFWENEEDAVWDNVEAAPER